MSELRRFTLGVLALIALLAVLVALTRTHSETGLWKVESYSLPPRAPHHVVVGE